MGVPQSEPICVIGVSDGSLPLSGTKASAPAARWMLRRDIAHIYGGSASPPNPPAQQCTSPSSPTPQP